MTRFVPELSIIPVSLAWVIGRSTITVEHRRSDMIQQADVTLTVTR